MYTVAYIFPGSCFMGIRQKPWHYRPMHYSLIYSLFQNECLTICDNAIWKSNFAQNNITITVLTVWSLRSFAAALHDAISALWLLNHDLQQLSIPKCIIR